MGSLISSFPSIDPIVAMILFIFIPPIIMLISIRLVWRNYHWRGSFLNKFVSNLGVVLNHHAPLVTIVYGFLGILLFLNQGSYLMNHYSTASDVKYYLRVHRPAFTNYNAIFNAQALNSIHAIRLQINDFGSRRLDEELSDHRNSTATGVGIFQDDSTRRLQQTSSEDSGRNNKPTDLLNFIYYRNDWGAMTTEQQLVDVCLTERNIFDNVPCLDNAQYDYAFRSFISVVMNTSTCEFLSSYEQARGQIGYFANSRYFSDGTMYSSIDSPVLISYFRMGSCGEVYGVNEFLSVINAQAVGDTVVAPASFQYLAQDMEGATDDLEDVMFYSALYAFIFLVLSVRGVIVAVATLFCVALSMVNGGAMLNHFGYSSLSVFNSTSLLVLLSVGAGFVHLYGAAWRRTVKRGKNASPQCLMLIFGTVGKGNLLTFLACCLAFFALGNAPVIFMSQMGYFLGISMIVFFVSFHYIIVPLWVWTSWYTIPSKYHNYWRMFRQQNFYWLLSKDKHVHRRHRHNEYEHNMGTEDHGEPLDDESQSSASSASSASTVVAAVVAPDQVRFASEVEGRAAQAEAVPATAAVAPEDAFDEHGNYIGDQPLVQQWDEDHHEGDATPAGQQSADSAVPGESNAEAAVVDRDKSGCNNGVRAYICNWFEGKSPVKLIGLFVLLLTLFLILLSAIESQRTMKTEFAYAQLMKEDTNMARVLQVFQHYRGDVFYAVDDDSTAVIEIPYSGSDAPTAQPTARPTLAGNPTAQPTARPTLSPRPTIAPTRSPSLPPTAMPTTQAGSTALVYTDFRVTGCWGLGSDKLNYDSGADPTFSYSGFRDYMEKDGEGLVGDMVAVCDYVDQHREYLQVHPDWNRTRDCISDQYFDVYASFSSADPDRTVANTVFKWGLTYETAPTLVGLLSNATQQATIPVWVCANFTGRMYLSSFHSDMNYGVKLRTRWEDAFYEHGSANAQASSVSVIVGATDFTYPLLGLYITNQVQYEAIVFVVGFAMLLLLFTWFDWGLTFFGVLGVFTIYLLTIFIALYQVSATMNMGDVVVLIVLLPYMVCFNIHLISSYMSNRTRSFRKTRRAEPSFQFWSPTLLKTQRYMVKALTGPLILALIASVAFLKAEYPILQRFGRYYLICAVVAYLFCVLIQPFLLAFSFRCQSCDLDYVEGEGPADEGSRQVDLVPLGSARQPQQTPPSTHSGGNPRLARPGSQFAMNSVYHNTSQLAMDNDAHAVGAVSRTPQTGSVGSRSDLYFSDSDPDIGVPAYSPQPTPPSMNTSQYIMVPAQSPSVGVAYGSPQVMQPAYDYRFSGEYQQPVAPQYDEYGRPLQMVQVPMQPVGYRRISSTYSNGMQPSPMPPMPPQQQYYYPQQQLPLTPQQILQQEEEYEDSDSEDGDGSQAYSQAPSQVSAYESSPQRQMFLQQPRAPQQDAPPPSFYSNGRNSIGAAQPRPYPLPPAQRQMYNSSPYQHPQPPQYQQSQQVFRRPSGDYVQYAIPPQQQGQYPQQPLQGQYPQQPLQGQYPAQGQQSFYYES